jgi:hypothetical protein
VIELVAGLQAGKEAIGLVSALANLIKDCKSPNEDPSLKELLGRLQIDAIRLSRDLENRLRTLSDHIQEYHLNPALTLSQQFEDLTKYDFVARARFKSVREECHAIHRQLTTFLDDATAMLICMNNQQATRSAFKASFESKRDLDRLFLDSNTPLGTLIDGMLATASRVTAELQAA